MTENRELRPEQDLLSRPGIDRLLQGTQEATLVTLNPDGTPQLSMVWIGRDGDTLRFGAENRRQKIRNLRRNPTVSLVIRDEERAPNGLTQYLVVHGKAEITGPGVPEEFDSLMDGLARRYLGTDIYPMPNRSSETAVVVRIKPERIGGVGPWALA